MIRRTVTVGRNVYALAAGSDREALYDRMVSAVRSGGDLVELPVVGDERISVLVSPGVPVTFREHDPGSSGDDADPAASSRYVDEW